MGARKLRYTTDTVRAHPTHTRPRKQIMKFLPVFVVAFFGLVAAECPKGYYSGVADGPCNFACSEGCECVAPNHCVCGESGAQIVAKKGTYPDENGQEGYNCVSLRKDGIWGAGLALIVVTVSISICGGIERSLNKNK